VDASNAAHLGRALATETGRGGDVTLDLASVAFLDSTGLEHLIRAARNLEGRGRLILVSPQQPIRRLFELVLLDRRSNVEIRKGPPDRGDGPPDRGKIDTPALRAIDGSSLRYRVVRTARPNSVEESAALQGIEIGQLLRTIVVRRGADDYVFVLVPGGRQIDWPKLRAHLGVNRLSLPDQDEARAATGYERGAITPFGSIRAWPVLADAAVAGLETVAIGGGGRGINLHLSPADLLAHLGAGVADVTRPAAAG